MWKPKNDQRSNVLGFLGVLKMLSIESNCDIFSIPFLVAQKKGYKQHITIGE